jgi:SWI/SNF-related matrix-associated actin-dependent regulator 1 of chromatin subfamily A
MSTIKLILELPHQSEGTKFLLDNAAAALFDEQGLGKSKQVIDALSTQMAECKIDSALIICPNGLKTNWGQEIEKFSTGNYAIFGAGHSARRMAFRSLKASFYVINYESVDTELASLKALLRFKRIALVLDESHRIKTPEAKTTQAVLALRSLAARRYILSGTPVANKPEDLWSQMLFLDDGEALGNSAEHFQQTYGSASSGYRNLEQLRSRVATKSLRRLKSAAVSLPSKEFRRVGVALSGRQAQMYSAMKTELTLWIRDMDGARIEERADAILARLVRLAQLASNPSLLDTAYVETPAKFLQLDHELGERMVDPTQKVIIWTSFVENINALRLRYKCWNPVCIHGAIRSEERDAAVRAFKTDLNTRVLIANPAAAREGLTLTEANLAIYLDRTFNLVDYLQSQDRIHRISQTRDCEIVLLIAQNTVDEFIDFALEQKHRVAQFAQYDSHKLSAEDALMIKPEDMRRLIQDFI